MVPIAGSAYTYAYATLGEVVAWIIGWDLLLEYGISVAPAAASWSGYVQAMLLNFGSNCPSGRKSRTCSSAVTAWTSPTRKSTFWRPASFSCSRSCWRSESRVGLDERALVVVQVIAIVVFIIGLRARSIQGTFTPCSRTGTTAC